MHINSFLCNRWRNTVEHGHKRHWQRRNPKSRPADWWSWLHRPTTGSLSRNESIRLHNVQFLRLRTFSTSLKTSSTEEKLLTLTRLKPNYNCSNSNALSRMPNWKWTARASNWQY